MVFERMSEDCIGALVTAQQQAAQLGLKQVDTTVFVAGIVDNPEHRAMDRTLAKYGITWRKVTKTLNEMHASTTSSSSSVGLQSFPRSKKSPTDQYNLPFSKEAKSAMMRAAKLADQMGSTTIQSHHLFLALLEYEEVNGKATAATVGDDDICHCGALAVTAMLAAAEAESPFLRSSEKEFSKKLHKFRGLNGNLQLDKLTPEDMLQLQTRIKASSEELSNLARTAVGDNAKDMMSAIADTGCSYSALNSFHFVQPSSIRRLSQPLKLSAN